MEKVNYKQPSLFEEGLQEPKTPLGAHEIKKMGEYKGTKKKKPYKAIFGSYAQRRKKQPPINWLDLYPTPKYRKAEALLGDSLNGTK